ncbi:MAG: MATE family efflux transporter [Myxococcota bacterium]
MSAHVRSDRSDSQTDEREGSDPDRSWSDELRVASRLAWPLALSQVGHHFLGFVDTYLAGKVSAETLGAISIGNSVYFGASVLGMGLMMGLDAVASQALGGGRARAGRRALWQGFYLAAAVSVPLVLLMFLVSGSLPAIGVVPELSEGTAGYINARSVSILPWLTMTACRSYLQAARLTRPIVVATVVANLFNFVADAVVLFGDDALVSIGLSPMGLPTLGAAGVGWASTVSTLAQALVLAWAVRWVPVPAGPRSFRRIDRELAAQIARIGAPVGMQLFAEVFIFSYTGVLMGRMGADVAAAHQVALIYASLSFSICVGIGASSSVLVGRAVGQGDARGARRAGIATLGLALAVMVISATIMVSAGESLCRFMIDRDEVVPLATTLLMVAAAFQLVDGVQAVAAGALRGAGNTRFSLLFNLVGHWVVGIPVGLALCFSAEWGAVGLWWGLTCGLSVVAVALAWKFFSITARPIASVVAHLSE